MPDESTEVKDDETPSTEQTRRSSHCYASMDADRKRLCRLMRWDESKIGLMPCKDSYGLVLGMWEASELIGKLLELSKAVCDQQLAGIGQEFLDGMAE